jgi:hypothetical protein
MGFKKGLSPNISLPSGNRSGGIEQLTQMMAKVNGGTQVGRVTDIILNENYPDIEKYGGLNGIGTIFFELNSTISNKGATAKPFYPQISAYPLINELVLLFKLPNNNIGKNTSEESYYYINMVNLWNHPHHNAYPNPLTSPTLPPEQQKDYQQTQAGSVRRITDESTEIEFNSPVNPSQDTFIEKTNIHPLLPFAGDVIYQGRWGNSIRLGSTAKPKDLNALNNWSSVGENGDPIIIIRNGQPTQISPQGWVPITENINKDQSDIFLTSNQQIPIKVASNRYFSYTPSFKEIPTSPSQYTGNQVIINSGRLLFNSKTDHIMLSSQRTISFEAVKGFNFDTPANFVIDVGTHIKLGSRNAKESVIKGDTLYRNLNNLVTSLIQVVQLLKFQQKWPAGNPVPDAEMSVVASSAETMLNQIQGDLKNILSKKVKTI